MIIDLPAPPHACLECAALEVRVGMLETAILGREQVQYGIAAQSAVEIIADTCAMFDVSREDLFDGGRQPRISQARFAAYWTIRVCLKWSMPRIARALRLKDHTSVLHGLSRASELRDCDPLFAERTDYMLGAHYEREKDRWPAV